MFYKGLMCGGNVNHLICILMYPRYLHIAVAQGKRALSYVLACKMAAVNMLDVKEHNNQVSSKTLCIYLSLIWSLI